MAASPTTSLLARLKAQKISLSAAPFYASLLVILALAIFIGIFWAINEYQAYQESIESIKSTYNQQYQDRVKEELDKVIDFIDYTRDQATNEAEVEIRNRVQSAYSIASHLYSMYKDEMEVDEIRSMAVEVLRPVRWFGERGYYFAGQTDTGVIDLFADEPFFEGQTSLTTPFASDRVVADMIEIVREKGAGIYRYNLVMNEPDPAKASVTAAMTVLVAKQAAEVAVLSNDRLVLGVGVGWNTVEYDGLNEEFADIVLLSRPDGTEVRVADVGTVVGAEVATDMGIATCFSLAPDPHNVIQSVEGRGELDDDAVVREGAALIPDLAAGPAALRPGADVPGVQLQGAVVESARAPVVPGRLVELRDLGEEPDVGALGEQQPFGQLELEHRRIGPGFVEDVADVGELVVAVPHEELVVHTQVHLQSRARPDLEAQVQVVVLLVNERVLVAPISGGGVLAKLGKPETTRPLGV